MRLLMALALRMGRPLSELRQVMSAGEFMLWAEYDRESPISDVRHDYHAAQISSAIYGSQGVKAPISDTLIRWSGEDASESDAADPFASLEASLSKIAHV